MAGARGSQVLLLHNHLGPLTLLAQVVTAENAHTETWLDEEYQLGPKVRDVRDHGELWGTAH